MKCFKLLVFIDFKIGFGVYICQYTEGLIKGGKNIEVIHSCHSYPLFPKLMFTPPLRSRSFTPSQFRNAINSQSRKISSSLSANSTPKINQTLIDAKNQLSIIAKKSSTLFSFPSPLISPLPTLIENSNEKNDKNINNPIFTEAKEEEQEIYHQSIIHEQPSFEQKEIETKSRADIISTNTNSIEMNACSILDNRRESSESSRENEELIFTPIKLKSDEVKDEQNAQKVRISRIAF